MNRTKYFVFIVMTMAIMLLIVGNWVTSVQATSISSLDVTPIPTGTLVVTPDTPMGEIPSTEEQEKLKAIVQSYVDIRYRALSVSDAEDFKQNGFGSLAVLLRKSTQLKIHGFASPPFGGFAILVLDIVKVQWSL